jgi:ribosomal protein S18 acetylase RimI-like enzyme
LTALPNPITVAVSLRPAQDGDEDFFYRLYASTRQAEMAAWGWDSAQQNIFLQMQFRAQRVGYASQFPDAESRVILIDHIPAGRIIVHRTPTDIRLVDIALLPGDRNRGIGTRVISDLIAGAEAVGKAVLLQVAKGNPAIHLYQRLGFSNTAEDEIFYQMSCPPRLTSRTKA